MSSDGEVEFTVKLFKLDESYYTSDDSKHDCFMAPFTEGIFLNTLS